MKRGHESGYARVEATNLKCKVSEIMRGLDEIEGSSVEPLISDRHDEIVALSYEMLIDLLRQYGIKSETPKEYFGDYIQNKKRIYSSLGVISLSFRPKIVPGAAKLSGKIVICLINFRTLSKVGVIICDTSGEIGKSDIFLSYGYDTDNNIQSKFVLS